MDKLRKSFAIILAIITIFTVFSVAMPVFAAEYAQKQAINENQQKVYTLIDANTDTYIYDTVWKDKLISYNGQTITYDAVGNPTNYMGNTLTWTMGRQLASFGNNTYTYDENGIRTSKTVNGVTTKYYLDGTRLIELTDGNDTLHFNYDREGEAIGFTHYFLSTGVDDPVMIEYVYIKNAMGDVIGITNPSGSMLVSYEYDPWGKLISVESNFGPYDRDISLLNPLRYRGYIYDDETGLYYLQSRYYDPEIGRFINSDDVHYMGLKQTELSYNTFAFCNNNPINNSDDYGFVANSLGKFIDSVIIASYVHCFLLNILKSSEITYPKFITRYNTGLYKLTVVYKNNQKKFRKLSLIFGDRIAWKNHSSVYNNESSIFILHFSQIINEESAKLGTTQKADALYIQFITSFLAITLIHYGIKASFAKKVYNAVWGSRGLDPRHSLGYYAFKVQDDREHNGSYAYSLKLNMVVTLKNV